MDSLGNRTVGVGAPGAHRCGFIISLAAGVPLMSKEMQTLAFQAGANGVYVGKKILQTATSSVESIKAVIHDLGMTVKPQSEKALV